MNLWDNEPILVLAIVNAVAGIGIAYGVNIDPSTKTALIAVLTFVFGLIGRSKVTPSS